MKKLLFLVPLLASGQTPMFFAVGSNVDLTDANNIVWKALPCPSTAVPYVVDAVGDKVLAQYRNLCYSTSSFYFDISVSTGNSGTYGLHWIVLHFIDPLMTTTNGRLFDVQINGDYYKRSLDVFAQVGQMTPYQIGYPIVAVNGKIQIKLSMVRRNAILSAIEIHEASDIIRSVL